MTLKRRNRFIVVSAAGIALVLGLARCTPLNPSMAKSLLRPGSESGTLSDSKPGSKARPEVAPAPEQEQIASFRTQVMDSSSFSDLKDKFSSMVDGEDSPPVQVIELDQSQLEDLREFRHTAVAIGEAVPSEAEVYVSIESSRPRLSRSELATFATELKHREDGTWELAIPRSLDSDKERTADAVLKNLDSVMISVRPPKDAASASADGSTSGGGDRVRARKPVHRPLGLEPRIHSVNEIRSLETSRRLLSLISSSQAL